MTFVNPLDEPDIRASYPIPTEEDFRALDDKAKKTLVEQFEKKRQAAREVSVQDAETSLRIQIHEMELDALKRMKARKDDSDKVRMDLIPPEAMFALAENLTYGAKKYDDRNWETNGGMKWGRLFGAAMRHLWAWWWRKGKDPETGQSHLWHAFSCIAFLITYEMRGYGEDDRHGAAVTEDAP